MFLSASAGTRSTPLGVLPGIGAGVPSLEYCSAEAGWDAVLDEMSWHSPIFAATWSAGQEIAATIEASATSATLLSASVAALQPESGSWGILVPATAPSGMPTVAPGGAEQFAAGSHAPGAPVPALSADDQPLAVADSFDWLLTITISDPQGPVFAHGLDAPPGGGVIEALALPPQSITELSKGQAQSEAQASPLSPTGAAPTVMTARASVSVEEFRAPGPSDSQVVQRALDAAHSRGVQEVTFDNRDYTFSETVYVRSGLSLWGDGATVRWPTTGPAFSFFRVENASNVEIEGFNFRWTSRPEAASTVQTHAVVVSDSRDVRVVGNGFFESKAIHIVGSDSVYFRENQVIRGAEGVVVGALVTQDISSVRISTNIFIEENYFQAQRREAVDVNSNARDVFIRKNEMIGGDSGRAGALHVDELIDIGGGVIRNVVVAENILNAAGTYTAALRAKLGVHNLRIEDNQIFGLVPGVEGGGVVAADVSALSVRRNDIVAPGSGIVLLGRVVGEFVSNRLDSASGSHITIIGSGNQPLIDRNALSRGTLQPPGRVTATEGPDVMYGGPQADTITGLNGDDFLGGGRGNDRLFGGLGNDSLVGGGGDDSLEGGDGDDLLSGDQGRDTLRGGAGNDLLYGADGVDALFGDGGDDRLYGEAGNDRLDGNDGNDSLYGGAGNDSLRGGPGNDSLEGGGGADSLLGEDGDDALLGEEGADTLDGGAGNDVLIGGPGSDHLIGGAGTDTLEGGQSADTLQGGADNDVFLYRSVSDSVPQAPDLILDFVRGQDVIDLSLIDADPRLDGDQAFAFIGTRGFSGQRPEARYVHADGGTLIQLNLPGDIEADAVIRLSSRMALSQSDFIL